MSEPAYDSTGTHPVSFGRFLLLRSVNDSAGAGSIAIAYDSHHKKLVVVKRLGAEKVNDETAVARFRDEINIAFRLTHPNLVSALDWGVVDGELFLALEWIEGQTTQAVVQRSAAMDKFVPLRIVGGIVVQVCAALDYAHARHGFVHRDISPANVMVGYDGVVRLIDYGLALSSVKSSHTMQGFVAGTSGYIAPERVHGHADRRSDLFALAAVCWNVMTTAPLLSQGEDESTKTKLCEKLCRFRKDAPAALGEFLWTALHRDPSRRFQSARAMGDALQSSLESPVASEQEIAIYLDGLFSHEKRNAAGELAQWSALYELHPQMEGQTPSPTVLPAPAAGNTAVLPRISESRARAASAIRRDTAVIASTPAVHRPTWFVVAGLAAALLLAVAIVLAMRSDSNRPSARVVARPRPQQGADALPLPGAALVTTGPIRDEATPSTEKPRTHKSEGVRAAAPVHRAAPGAPRVPTSAPVALSIDEEIRRANGLLQRGQTASARRLLDELAREPTARPRALVASAKLEWHQGNYDDAIRIASEASHAGAGADAISVRAFAELDARQYARAVQDFKHVLDINPNDADARDGLGAAEQQLRKTDR